MKKLLLIFLIFFSFNLKALTYGGYSCGQVLSWERENNQTQIDMTMMLIAGFVKGFNYYLDSNEQVFSDADEHTMWYLLVKECRESPEYGTYISILSILEREKYKLKKNN